MYPCGSREPGWDGLTPSDTAGLTGGCAKGWNQPERDGSSQGTGRKPLSRHRAVGDSCMEVLCLKNCLSSAVIHFNKGRMERNSFACLHRPALLQQQCSNPGSCAGGEKVVSSERQADRQTDSEPAAPLLCARSSKTIPGAICNQEQNQAAGRAPRETVPVQSWLAF